MKKEEKLNEEAALNNNLGSTMLQRNNDIAKQHQKPKTYKTNETKN
ncbi:hypothetical protein GMD78_20025 [Ornithinibacillus sp. L9]|uniref:Uncharacterized protein n=1 Tax=Ornithinibacillus caprae TaxID=2678566 RepID=A0A6N8FP24_9BACI|nr:hypothetical protein [Ornithinibacillus caprae]MUK90646.1 hypothetical protein [Ornithinibacillus caprae]